MPKIFFHPVGAEDATKRLLSIRQGSRSLAQDTVAFSSLPAEACWDEDVPQALFASNIRESVKDDLGCHPEHSDVDRCGVLMQCVVTLTKH